MLSESQTASIQHLITGLRNTEFRGLGYNSRSPRRSVVGDLSSSQVLWNAIAIKVAEHGESYSASVRNRIRQSGVENPGTFPLIRYELARSEYTQAQELAAQFIWVRSPPPIFWHLFTLVDGRNSVDMYSLTRGSYPFADIAFSLFMSVGVGVQLVVERHYRDFMNYLSSDRLTSCSTCRCPRVRGRDSCPFCGMNE